MTTEPKFVPKEAAIICLDDDISVKIRLIDCVGYMVEGAAGYVENDAERMVKTPWFDTEIPFTKAAGIGTKKVIHEHSTIGIVITTDGSIGEIPRKNPGGRRKDNPGTARDRETVYSTLNEETLWSGSKSSCGRVGTAISGNSDAGQL